MKTMQLALDIEVYGWVAFALWMLLNRTHDLIKAKKE